jgi:hypothetical protein
MFLREIRPITDKDSRHRLLYFTQRPAFFLPHGWPYGKARRKDNIKMERDTMGVVWTRLIELRIGTIGGLL